MSGKSGKLPEIVHWKWNWLFWWFSSNYKALDSVLTLKLNVIWFWSGAYLTHSDKTLFKSVWLGPPDRTITSLKKIKMLIQHFSKPMKASGFEKLKFYNKWCPFQTTVNLLLQHQKYQEISERTLTYCLKGFPNIYVLAELASKLSSPNSLFKKVLTILTTIIANWCQNIYKANEGYNLIVRNKNIWSEKENDELRESATRKYLSEKNKRKKVTWHCIAGPSTFELLSRI